MDKIWELLRLGQLTYMCSPNRDLLAKAFGCINSGKIGLILELVTHTSVFICYGFGYTIHLIQDTLREIIPPETVALS